MSCGTKCCISSKPTFICFPNKSDLNMKFGILRKEVMCLLVSFLKPTTGSVTHLYILLIILINDTNMLTKISLSLLFMQFAKCNFLYLTLIR